MKAKKRALILSSAALMIALASLLIWRFWPRSAPEYAPPARDPLAASAQDFPADLPTLRTDVYDVSLNPDLRVDGQGDCEILFKNPARNGAHLMLDVRLQESNLLIYRTGLVAPGEGIRAIRFVPDALAALQAGAQPVTLTVYSFALETYLSMGEINLQTQLTYDPEG